jgi:hypothetical protein
MGKTNAITQALLSVAFLSQQQGKAHLGIQWFRAFFDSF